MSMFPQTPPDPAIPAAPAIPLDPAIATIRDGAIAIAILLVAFVPAAWILLRRETGPHYQEQLKYALLIAALGGTIGLGITAYLNAQAVTALLGLIVGYAAGARTTSSKSTEEPDGRDNGQDGRDPGNR